MSGIRSVLATALFSFSLLSSDVAYARPITLADALVAAEQSPALGIAHAQVDQSRGNLEQAELYMYNPALTGAAGVSRVSGSGGGGSFFDFEIGISQAIELGGKRNARSRSARAERDAASENRDAVRNAIRAEVRRAFELAIVAQSRVGVTTENERAAREFRDAANERLKLGAATQTDVNVAVSVLGRAIAAKKAAERDLLLARQALGDALGVSGADLEPSGPLPTFAKAGSSEDQLVASALRERRDLLAIDHRRDARSADVDLADAQAVPDPELSVSWARDAVDQANAVVVGLRIELPIWNRNQGNRQAARALRTRVTIEARAYRAGVEREVRTSFRRYGAATDAIASFDQQVVGTLAENLKLARDSLAAGKLGLLDLNNVRRDLVDSQLTYLDSIAEAIESRAALERAIGRSLEGTP
jgi:cobalt-zinc-cadmium efflux system outer membrane protein